MTRRTALYDSHLADGARMVDFGGWEMPIHYGSQIEEHHEVRQAAGMFDVSHMTVVDIRGNGCRAFLSHLLANDVARLQVPGRALYTCMLNEQGGVIDDLIVYHFAGDWFRLVVNAATRDKDLAWLKLRGSEFDVTVTEDDSLAMIAVQGPEARMQVRALLADEDAGPANELKPFYAGRFDGLMVARTGYTGEDGFEVLLPESGAAEFWSDLRKNGVRPCGLGARDTLRLEAGMNLYGQDMDETVTPLESALGWTVAMKDDRQFIGREALEAQKASGVPRRLVGLVLEGRGVLRPGQTVHTSQGEGITTSGTFSPSLQRAIAFARIPSGDATTCQVDIRGKMLDARIVRPPFVRNGAACDGIV